MRVRNWHATCSDTRCLVCYRDQPIASWMRRPNDAWLRRLR